MVNYYRVGQWINFQIVRRRWLWRVYNPIYQLLSKVPIISAHVDTIDICRDKTAIKNLRQAVKDCKDGRTISWDELKRELEISKRP